MNIQRIIVGSVRTNCFFLSNDKKCIVVDPGAEAQKIVDFINKEELTPVAIFLTHGHFDHIMAVNELKEKYGIKVYVSAIEKEMLTDPYINCSVDFGLGYTTDADVLLNDGDCINIAGIDIEVILTSGHTAGACCYYIEKENTLIAGDTLFFRSVGRCDLPTGDEKALFESLKKLMELPEETVVYCGHGPKTTIGAEREANPYIRGLV